MKLRVEALGRGTFVVDEQISITPAEAEIVCLLPQDFLNVESKQAKGGDDAGEGCKHNQK